MLIFVFAFRARFLGLMDYFDKLLDPDAIVYLDLAKNLPSPFQTDFREPVFIWQVWLFIKIFGSDPHTIRLLSFFLSFVVLWLTFFIGKRLFNDCVAFFSTFLIAINATINFMSIRGLRFEWQIIIFLLLIYALFFLKLRKKILEAIFMGILGGISLLSFLTFIILLAVILILKAIKDKWRWHLPIFSFVMSLVIILPYLLYCQKEFNDPFYAINCHNKFYRNLEFAGRPGFPSVEEVKRDAYAGEELSSFDYLFGLHSYKEIVKNSLRGFYRIYLGSIMQDLVFEKSRLLWVMYLVGIVCIIFSAERLLLIPFFLWGGLLSFLAGTIVIDPRLVIIFAPVAYFISAFGLYKSILFFLPQGSKSSQTSI